jgi:hypothetical protein
MIIFFPWFLWDRGIQPHYFEVGHDSLFLGYSNLSYISILSFYSTENDLAVDRVSLKYVSWLILDIFIAQSVE